MGKASALISRAFLRATGLLAEYILSSYSFEFVEACRTAPRPKLTAYKKTSDSYKDELL